MKKWYAASYGFEVVIGQEWVSTEKGKFLRFRWGGPFREKNFVHNFQIIGEVPDPRLFGWAFRLFNR